MRSGSAYLGERIWWRILFWNQARNAFINYQIWHPIKTSIPSRGSILLVASCYGNQNKFWPDGPLGSYADLRCTVRTKKTKVVKTGLLIFFARTRSREFQVNPRNPAKFTITREIPRNSLEILPNTCRHNIFESYLGCWGCLQHNIPKLPGVLRLMLRKTEKQPWCKKLCHWCISRVHCC